MIEVKPKRMPNDEWGIASRRPLTVGTRVKVVTRKGKSWEATVTVLHGETEYGEHLAEADKDWDSVRDGVSPKPKSKPKPVEYVEGESGHLDLPTDLSSDYGAEECIVHTDLPDPDWADCP